MAHTTGCFTLPSESNFAEKTAQLAELWGADAIRNSDGTHLDDAVRALGKRIYSAYFPTRAHNEWITLHMTQTPQVYLLTDRALAEAGEGGSCAVTIPLMESFFEEQLAPNWDADPKRYWEVVDRTTGGVVDPALWDADRESCSVTVTGATPMHEYTVSFLAYIIWDPVEMYNHLTNDWGDKEHEIPFDIYHPATRDFVFRTFERWLKDNPDTDVVRFTTFFYQFTLLFDQRRREKIVDWFGCSCTVCPEALDDFEREYGYRLRPEDFVDQGCYNSAWRVPGRAQRDWIDFLSGFVRANVKRLASMAHESGKEAMMFLGDQWIGTEPYKDGFADLGLDAVVGSIGDGTTTRMIADIPGVRYTEGRFLPYFFPDTFYEGNDPSVEGLDNWRKARRAILRSPIDRMGYGGYLSLAAKFPKFVDTVARIADEFRDIRERTGGRPAEGMLNVAILNCWGRMRSWMAFTVAHALPNKQTASYYGVLEALSGMRVNVRFISFDDVLAHGVDPDVDVVVTGGPADTSWSGGDVWRDARLVETLRAWVRSGGALVGVGEPSAAVRFQGGRLLQLADVFGVDEERFQTLSVDKYFPPVTPDHFITADVPVDPAARAAWERAGYRAPLSGCGGGQGIAPLGGIDFGEPILNTFPVNEDVTLLRADGGQVQLAANGYGRGRGVYVSGLPYSAANARLLERMLFWAAGAEDRYAAYSSSNPECEVAHWPDAGLYCVVNNTDRAQSTDVTLPGGAVEHFDLEPSGIAWR
ncbi:1,3-beta-galactosyl-N-acetylhexosamine phosphorylase [Bifidobacterium vespertilionis]|uniref:1,3-beta-galactosyl-N-acetylhexosamine phosphorylase n=1 Tax=Bifidobacterium vespertilionis TaxID=2562524 RepID=UPI001BDD156E|nr:1,3-beta-galactosyl-N-acetylhexosamine phosphorylase [Bifidobacterium vespertilionis]MBT1178509.1 1,3-beta-galactosyl-N-acetylhexosamine phosphorylase [Bifidobacterium vespertilionis]